MIIPMVKYDFLLYHGDLNTFLERLQDLGVVDVESHGVVKDNTTNNLVLKAKHYESVARELSAIKLTDGVKEYSGSMEDLVSAYSQLKDQRTHLNTQIVKTEKDIDEAQAWGEFRLEDIERLRRLHLQPHYYVVTDRKFKEEWCLQYVAQEINRFQGKVYFVLLQEMDAEWQFDLSEVKPPDKPYTLLMEDLKVLNASYAQCQKQLESMACAVPHLKVAQQRILEQIDFNTAATSATDGADGTLKSLTAWVPATKNDALLDFLSVQSVYYVSEHKPSMEAGAPAPPILLKNNRFVKLFEPITRLYSLPNYQEIDPTPLFAPFFMLFFGFCLGDGGYGIIIFLTATLLKIKIKDPEIRPFLSLGQWLSAATVFFGFISGTFFGVTFDGINLAQMAESHFNLPKNFGMLILALLLGAVQIIFGMCVNVSNVVMQHGWKFALAKIAWVVIILLGAVYFGCKNSLSPILLNLLYALLGMAVLVAFFYNSPGKNLFLNMGAGIWDSYNTASGLLGDMLSYIRLFALGMTGGILGSVFNQLAMDMSGDIPVLSWVIMLFILLFGHSLNIALNSLGAFVHPLRLTFVEYYKNSGFEGGGRAYRPLRKN